MPQSVGFVNSIPCFLLFDVCSNELKIGRYKPHRGANIYNFLKKSSNWQKKQRFRKKFVLGYFEEAQEKWQNKITIKKSNATDSPFFSGRILI